MKRLLRILPLLVLVFALVEASAAVPREAVCAARIVALSDAALPASAAASCREIVAIGAGRVPPRVPVPRDAGVEAVPPLPLAGVAPPPLRRPPRSA